jgi:hypothetical protein
MTDAQRIIRALLEDVVVPDENLVEEYTDAVLELFRCAAEHYGWASENGPYAWQDSCDYANANADRSVPAFIGDTDAQGGFGYYNPNDKSVTIQVAYTDNLAQLWDTDEFRSQIKSYVGHELIHAGQDDHSKGKMRQADLPYAEKPYELMAFAKEFIDLVKADVLSRSSKTVSRGSLKASVIKKLASLTASDLHATIPPKSRKRFIRYAYAYAQKLPG